LNTDVVPQKRSISESGIVWFSEDSENKHEAEISEVLEGIQA